ncbi:T9SS type A sorting domain-containing protein [bacterium]|nr:T9SS type A sorting domain-containing protein [bacterium]
MPSCPGARDGSLQVIEIKRFVNPYILALDLSTLRAKLIPPVGLRFGSGSSIIEQDANLRYDDLSKGNYYIQIELREHNIVKSEKISLDPTITSNFGPSIFVDNSSRNETCPGTNDAYIKLKIACSPFESDPKIHWSDGITTDFVDGFIERSGLTSGVYPFIAEKTFSSTQKCCFNSAVVVKSNYCANKILTENFDNGIPSTWFVDSPTSLEVINNTVNFINGTNIYIPFDVDLNNVSALFGNFNLQGSGVVQIIDQNFNPLASIAIDTSSEHGLLLNNLPVNHGYFVIEGMSGSTLSNVCLTTFQNIIEYPSHFKESMDIDLNYKVVPQNYCIGDTIYPYSGLTLTGGISPYEFTWALDSDMIFNDADSLDHPIQFTTEGSHSIALLIEDFVGNRDTAEFIYNVFGTNPITLSADEIGILNTNNAIQTVCLDQVPFTINTVPASAVLSSTSSGLNTNTFDPQVAGVGFHQILAEGGPCAPGAILGINVIEFQTSEIYAMPVLYTCEQNIDLSLYVENVLNGVWMLEDNTDTLALFVDTLPVSIFAPGNYILKYILGSGLCESISSTPLTIASEPTAAISNLPDTLMISSPVLNLNSLLSSSSSLGGEWSGTGTVDNFFDPSNLTPGTYTVTYTVGPDNCLAITSTEIVISTCNGSPVTNNLSISICDDELYEGYSLSGNYIDTFTGANGCDSTRVLDLIVKDPITPTNIESAICDGECYGIYKDEGMYNFVLQSALGCDSVINLDLTVHPVFEGLEEVSICEDESYNGYTEAGTYTQDFISTNGCDSIVDLILTVLDTLDPLCMGTSVSEIEFEIKISPIPATSFLEFESLYHGSYFVDIYDVSGTLVKKDNIQITNNLSRLDISELNPGIHLLQIYGDKNISKTFKIIKM